MTFLAISDNKLQIGDVVNAAADHAPYTVTAIKDDFVTFTGLDGEFTDNSGYVYLVGRKMQIAFAKNTLGTIHAMLNDKPICGHQFTASSWTFSRVPTCEDCRKLLG